MTESEGSAATRQQPPPPANVQSEGQKGETHLTLAAKAIFWLLLVPVSLLLFVKWLLQSSWLQP